MEEALFVRLHTLELVWKRFNAARRNTSSRPDEATPNLKGVRKRGDIMKDVEGFLNAVFEDEEKLKEFSEIDDEDRAYDFYLSLGGKAGREEFGKFARETSAFSREVLTEKTSDVRLEEVSGGKAFGVRKKALALVLSLPTALGSVGARPVSVYGRGAEKGGRVEAREYDKKDDPIKRIWREHKGKIALGTAFLIGAGAYLCSRGGDGYNQSEEGSEEESDFFGFKKKDVSCCYTSFAAKDKLESLRTTSIRNVDLVSFMLDYTGDPGNVDYGCDAFITARNGDGDGTIEVKRLRSDFGSDGSSADEAKRENEAALSLFSQIYRGEFASTDSNSITLRGRPANNGKGDLFKKIVSTVVCVTREEWISLKKYGGIPSLKLYFNG